MNLPDKVIRPHTEMNEGGIEFDHPGYIERRCEICMRTFISTFRSPMTTCGNRDCGRDKEKVG